MERRLLVIIATLFIAACTMPETRIYSLHLTPEKRATDTNTDASLFVMVNAPRYLAQPYIVLRRSPYELEISRYAKWDAFPSEMTKTAFKDSLSSTGIFRDVRVSGAVPGSAYVLKIDLRRFERSEGGNDSFGELAFDVDFLSPDGKRLWGKSVSKRVKLEGKDYSDLAKALSVSLSEGIDEIRNTVAESLRGR